MKTNTTVKRGSGRAAAFAAAVLATCLLAGTANAQKDLYEGKFTLPYEARWGQVVLPPGDYRLTFVQNMHAKMLNIQDANSLRHVAFILADNLKDSTGGESALVIGTRGRQHVVCSLRIAELGETFIYANPPARGRAVEGARKTQTVQVLVAKK
jgi:hypothetical protein